MRKCGRPSATLPLTQRALKPRWSASWCRVTKGSDQSTCAGLRAGCRASDRLWTVAPISVRSLTLVSGHWSSNHCDSHEQTVWGCNANGKLVALWWLVVAVPLLHKLASLGKGDWDKVQAHAASACVDISFGRAPGRA